MILRILLMVIGITGIILFYLPLGKKGIINYGNAVGMIVSVLVLLFGTFSWLFSMNFKIVLCVIVLLILILVIVINMKMVNAKNNIAGNEDVVIVLGCSCKSSICEALNQRIKAAARYLDKHPDSICIASGGNTTEFYDSEAEYIAIELAKYGVPKSKIIVENKSKNTSENIQNSKRIIDEKGLSKSVAIATSEYHQYRASLYASRCGLKAKAINASTTKYMYPTYFTREIIAIVASWIRKK
ncbi:MAG: YdcF family protein [Lachnospiraceae bacterium]|nr:YdcF family protein [Lachnospiraceae bacterium]